MSNLVSFIHKSRQIIISNMERQGYDVSLYKDFTTSELDSMFETDQLDLIVEKNVADADNYKSKLYIKYSLKKPVKHQLQSIIDEIYNVEGVLSTKDVLCIIAIDSPNESLTSLLTHLYETDGLLIIVYGLETLQYSVLDHRLVPKHEIISPTLVEEIKNYYNICSNNQFPVISRYDPVAQAMFMRPGQLCKITRPSKTSIISLYYRICSTT